jgi:hypothetical protein
MAVALLIRNQRGSKARQWRFSLLGDNGEPVATSGSETYHNKADAEHTLAKYFPNFKIVEDVPKAASRRRSS